MDSGTETIEDKALKAQLRRQARKVYVEAILASALFTAFWTSMP